MTEFLTPKWRAHSNSMAPRPRFDFNFKVKSIKALIGRGKVRRKSCDAL